MTTTFTTAAARTAVVAAVVAALTGGALATAATASAAPVASSTLAPASDKHDRPSLQDVIDANNAARTARDKADAAATATGTARGTLDDRRVQLAIAQRDAQAAQDAVNTQKPVVDAANRTLVAAGDARKAAAQVTNADPNNASKEAAYDVQNQLFLNRLAELAQASQVLKTREQARDAKNADVTTKQGAVTQAETVFATAQANQTAQEKAAKQAEDRYAQVKKSYERGRR